MDETNKSMENDSKIPNCMSLLRTFARTNYSPSTFKKIVIFMEPIHGTEKREKAAEYIESLIQKSNTEAEFLDLLNNTDYKEIR